MRKIAFIIAAIIALCVGIIGIFIPFLPTTPFLLIAVFCAGKSSQKMHKWIMEHRVFGRHLRNYFEGKGVERRVKCLALVLLWVTIGCGVLAMKESSFGRIAALIAGVGVTIHIMLLKKRETIKIDK